MIPFILARLTALVGAKAAKPVLIASAVVLLVLGLGIAKCAYDKSVIKAHDAKQNAETQNRKIEADENASEQRREDDTRIAEQEKEANDAIAKTNDSAPSDAALSHNCIRLRRAGIDTSRFPECNRP